ncbi:prolyl oligopeptidase family serine peptidase [Acidobacteriota bacterium]
MMKNTFAAVSLSFLIITTGLALGDEPGNKLLKVDTYLEMESIRNPVISPDGNDILFTKAWVDKKKDRARSNLWITDFDGLKIHELTHGNWSDFSPAWSSDGKRIAFLSDRDGTTQIHVMWFDTKEVAQLTHLDRSPVSLRWSPDGKKIAFSLFVPDKRPLLPVKLPEFPRGVQLADPAVIIDRIVWALDGDGYFPKGNMHHFVIETKLGGTPAQITAGDFNYGDPRDFNRSDIQWSADGKKIFFSALLMPFNEVELEINESEIYSIDMQTHKIRTLTDRKGPDRGMRLSPDGKWIAYTGFDDQNYADGNISSLYIMDASGDKKRLLAGALPSSPSNVLWAPDSSGIYYRLEEKGVSNLYLVSLDGEKKEITQGQHYLSSFSIARNGRVAALRSDFYNPGYLVTFNLKDPHRVKKIVDLNEDVLDGVKLGEAEEMWFKSPDGLDLQGWLLKPSEFDPSKKYPLLLWIHGGPHAMYSVRWNWAWQNFAAEGYAVFYMNPRGSTGYGKDFLDGIQYSYPGKDFDDLMAGVDAAIAKGFIDEENLFVCGGSGGGILTAWIVGHTDRFRAAVAMRPIVNFHSNAGTADDPTDKYSNFRKFPWEDPMEWAKRSPLHYVGNVTTPTMLMTGELDLRTPMSQSEEFFRALKVLKKETLLIRMPGEYHGWRRPSHRILNQLYLKAWFEKYRLRH